MIMPITLKDTKPDIKLIIVRMSVIVHAHDFPLSSPHAMTKDAIPRAIIPPLTTPAYAATSIPIIPDMVAKNEPAPIADIPEIISRIARIVTPVGRTFWSDTESNMLTLLVKSERSTFSMSH